MRNRYRIEIKYGLITLVLLESLYLLHRTQAFRGFDTVIANFFEVMSGRGLVGFFIVALIANASILTHLPYTVPLLSLALSGAALNDMLLMGAASGLGAACGELVSYSIALKFLGDNATLERSSLLQGIKRIVHSHPHMIPLLLFVYAATPLPDDTLIIPLATTGYGIRKIALPLLVGKLAHSMGIAAVFYYFTGWSADRVSTTVQVDLTLGILIVFAMVVIYQVEKNRAAKYLLATEYSQ